MSEVKPYMADDGKTILWVPDDPANPDYQRVLNREMAECNPETHKPKPGEMARAKAQRQRVAREAERAEAKMLADEVGFDRTFVEGE